MEIDLDSLPKIAKISPSLCIDDGKIEALGDYPKCQSRMVCAQHFAWLSQTDDADIHPPNENYTVVREAYFRAALAEFGAIRDLFKEDFFEKFGKRPELAVALLPRIFQELRNLEFHLTTSQLSNSIGRAKLVVNFSSGEHSEKYHYKKWMLEFNRQAFMSLSNVNEAKGWPYSATNNALDWFDEMQRKWGVQPLFILALEEYVSCIVRYIRECK